MNKDIAREWVTALRSGEYPQGMGGLRQYGDLIRSEVTYCCLGVLCDVVAERTFMAVNPGAYGGYYDTESDPAIYHPFNNLLPPRVRKFAGTPNDDILITLTSAERETFGRGEESTGVEYLANLNDSGKFSFADIADMIERTFDLA